MEAWLSTEREPLLLTLGAAGATLLVMLVLLGAPAVNACHDDRRGLVTCMRDLIDARFELGGRAELPPASPPAAEVARTPDAAAAPADTEAPQTIALAEVDEPAAALTPAPTFVPPTPTASVEATPPDLVVSAPAPPAPAPDFVPPSPVVAVEGVPPDLQVAAAEPEPEPVALPQAPVPAPTPGAAVAAVAGDRPAAEIPPSPALIVSTIDAVEIDGERGFVAGDGPNGATMRLYVDGVPAGVSPVQDGRWLIEGERLLVAPRQALRVEALDPVTGRRIGEAETIFERPVNLPAASAGPATLPPIEPVKPLRESASVLVLKRLDGSSITTLAPSTSGDAAMPAPGSSAMAATGPAEAGAAQAAGSRILRAMPVGDPETGRFVSGKAIIRRGDTLWDIAHRYYGRGIHYRAIVRANPGRAVRPGLIHPGQVFDLPPVRGD